MRSIQLTFNDYKKNTKPVHDDKIVKVITSQDGESISSQIWPSFMDVTKQKERYGRRVLSQNGCIIQQYAHEDGRCAWC
jgi:hypothetical protein